MAEDGIVTVVCPECGKELCLIKYDSIIYWKNYGCGHCSVLKVGCDEDPRRVRDDMEEIGAEVIEEAWDGGYRTLIIHWKK